MRKLLKITAIVVVVLLVIVFGGGMLLSPKWEVTRSRVIPAPSAAIHAYVGDLAKWPIWSPFEKEDAQIQIQVGTPSAGVGAKRSWKSDKVGSGSQAIVMSDPDHGVAFTLAIEDFDPFTSEFRYEPAAGGDTKVTWTDRGDMGGNPLNRWMGKMMGAMMGGTFEQGLADLETAVVARE